MRFGLLVRTPIPQLTTFMLVVHLVVGCCWHHAHSCEVNCCETPTPTAQSCPCSGHRHEHSHDDQDSHSGHQHDSDQDSDHDGPRDHCCDGQSCVYVTTDVSPEQLGLFAQTSCPLDFETLRVPQLKVTHTHIGGVGEIPRSSGCLPLRTHLVNQVLLI